ncbi:MAG: adenosylcobinamide-GDP ribazoletransferase, partial [Methyloceanibacter sp.]
MANDVSLSGLSTELKTGLAFLTRLPVRGPTPAGEDLVRAGWTFPVIGAGVGVFGAFAYWLALALDLPPFVGATLAVAATLLLTGALHEDGLADTADGFGADASRERTLDIMRDSQIGTYGAIAISLSLLLRASAIGSIADAALVAAALIAAHAGARAAMLAFMRVVPNARSDGLSADAGAPPQNSALIAAGIATVLLLLCLGFGATLAALLLLAGAGAGLAWLSVYEFGGQT